MSRPSIARSATTALTTNVKLKASDMIPILTNGRREREVDEKGRRTVVV